MKRIYEITPPEALEKNVLSAFPDLDANVENLMNAKEDLPWPDWCFLPMAASYAIVTSGAEIPFAKRYMANAGIDMLRAVSAIVPWRLHKIIYRFDRDLADELMQKDSTPENIPAEVLHHMPYPCIYIENPPGLEDDFNGLFCFLEWDYRYPNATELRMHYLAKNGSVVGLYLQWDDNKAMLNAKMALNAQKLINEIKTSPISGITEKQYTQCVAHVYRHLNLLLYLCSDEPDTERRNPIPRRRGNGKIQVASYPDTIDVGTYIGSAIRASKGATEEEGSLSEGAGTRGVTEGVPHTTYRPHMRRAHWHLYWTGQGRTIPRVKWISPIFVNATGNDVPTSIHPVKR